MNVTLSLEDQLVARARKKAEALGKSLNQMIRDYLQTVAGGDDPERSIEEFNRLSGQGHSHGWRFNRDEIHTRQDDARQDNERDNARSSFFDTNVLVYADDQAAPAKQKRALELVAEHRRAKTGVVSLQVLQEYFVTVTRKLQVDVSIVRRKVELLAEFDVAAPEVADILAAIDLHRLHSFSFWDALILRAAKQAGCTVLLTEDMQQAREIDGVRVVNPFQ